MKKIIILVAALLNGCAVYMTPEDQAAVGGFVVGAAAGALLYGALDGHGCHNCYYRPAPRYYHSRPYGRPYYH